MSFKMTVNRNKSANVIKYYSEHVELVPNLLTFSQIGTLAVAFSVPCSKKRENSYNVLLFLFYLFVVFNPLLLFLCQSFVVFLVKGSGVFLVSFSVTGVSDPSGDDSLVVTTCTKRATIMIPLNGRPPEEENRLCESFKPVTTIKLQQ